MLIDSCMFIRWGRRRQSPTLILRSYIQRGDLMTCGVVRAEVLRGARVATIKQELMRLFSVMNEVETTSKIWEKTAELAWAMDRKGKPLPLTDLAIASRALAADVPLVTSDGHFSIIPGLVVYSDLP